MSQILLYLVDDDEVDREMIIKSLTQLDAEIDEAGTGQEFLDNVKKKAYDLLLIDYKLPDCTGFDIAKEVRRLGVNTTMILITGLGSEQLEQQSRAAGFLGYVQKDQITPMLVMTVLLKAFQEFQSEVQTQSEQAINKLTAIQAEIRERINFYDQNHSPEL